MKIHILNYDEKSQKMTAQSCVRFTELIGRAIFTYRKDYSNNPYSTDENDEYQRQINRTRVKDIKDFLREKILESKAGFSVIFPTAMLLACNLEDMPSNCSNGADRDIETPTNFFIVDGQHRLFSMIELYNEVNSRNTEEDKFIKTYLDKYEFNCTLLFNLDMWEQGQVFVDVNFKQKSVNKSLYYEIYGTKYPENSKDIKRNCIYIAHSLAKFVNSNEKSPLKGFVKMLGNGKGLFSQASLAEALMMHLSSPLGIWYVDPDAEVKSSYRYMTIELFSYFYVVANTFNDLWPKMEEMKHRSILCKTTGIQAMVKLMGFLHKTKMDAKIFDCIKVEKDITIYQPYANDVEKYLNKLKPYQNELFGLQDAGGQFCGTGGKGLVSKLYNRMVEIIND